MSGFIEGVEKSSTSPIPSALVQSVNVSGDNFMNLAEEGKLQIIDENQDFTTSLDSAMEGWRLRDSGFNYNVVAVFGSQSTGKSTLLNRLFGTKFDVMSETERRQTTKGIWMSKGKGMKVLVMDVEGTDGRERGEDQDFERKSALFSIAVAEVFIVNIWEHQVGLYQGANMGLLKTVFEVNLGLFLAAKQKGKLDGSPQDKTLLLFVIRDHIGATPLANLQNTLTTDLSKLWDGLSKPPGLESSKITDFFDIAFVTLPHKLLQPEQFESQVLELRKRFVDSTDPAYLFQPKYHKRIPADGISHFMSTIWEAVLSNKDLDLPTQQELLAQFRCDEIASVAFNVFSEAVTVLATNSTKLPVNLGSTMETARAAALTSFDTAASRYHNAVYTRKRVELMLKLNSTLSPFYLSYLKSLQKQVLKEFRVAVQDGLKSDGYDFATVVTKNKKKAEDDFLLGAKEATLADTTWSYEENWIQLQEDIGSIAELLRAEETKKMISQIERNIKKLTAENVELSLNKPTTSMWDKILINFKEALKKGEDTYVRKATGFNCTEKEMEDAVVSLRQRAWLALRAKIDEQTADSVMLVRMRSIFEDRFRYDAQGVPRVWKPEDDIDSVFKTAKDEVLGLLPRYADIKPETEANEFTLPSSTNNADLENPEFDFPSSLSIFTEARMEELSARFRKEADAYYIEAKRSTVSSIHQIPAWVYAVLAVLGWNEFVAVIRNPIYFLFILMLMAGCYIIIQLGLSGPVLNLTRGIAREVSTTAQDALRTYLQQPEPERIAVRASPRVKREEEEFELEDRKKVD